MGKRWHADFFQPQSRWRPGAAANGEQQMFVALLGRQLSGLDRSGYGTARRTTGPATSSRLQARGAFRLDRLFADHKHRPTNDPACESRLERSRQDRVPADPKATRYTPSATIHVNHVHSKPSTL